MNSLFMCNNLYKITDPQTAQEFRECYGFDAPVTSVSEVFVGPGLRKFGTRRIEAAVATLGNSFGAINHRFWV